MAVITISRQYGSGGNEIAARVCEILGYRIFDKTLMAKVAAEVELTAEIIDFSEDDHRVRGFLHRMFRGRRADTLAAVRTWSRDIGGLESEGMRQLDQHQAVDLVRHAIRAAYDEGNVVVVGRGGQSILRDLPDVLHIRVEAPVKHRIQRVLDGYGVIWEPNGREEQARAWIAQRDVAARDYLKRFHDVDWSDFTMYHMVLNASKWTVEAAAQLIVNGVGHLPTA